VTGAGARARRWRSHAFGLALDGSFALAGCPESAAPDGFPLVKIELGDRRSLQRLLPPASNPIAWRHDAAGRWTPDVIGHHTAGYLLDEKGVGVFHISRTGKHVRCALARGPAWRWQRFLFGRVLPFASTLRGLEPWHASAVAFPGSAGAVALVGDSHSGKSTLAAQLLLDGADFIADDVLALDVRDGGVTAHPGPGLISLRRSTVERLGPAELRRLGGRVGADTESVRLSVARHERSLPLAAVYLLEPAPADASPRLTPLAAPDPRLLLGGTFNLATQDPARLLRHLEVCATIARSVRVVRVRVPRGADHRAIAEQLQGDAKAGPGAAR
jgi:hypothetical protein